MGWNDLRNGNLLKETLAQGGTVVGSFVRMSSVEVTEACAHAGCDFVIIDMEHAPVTWERAAAMIIAAEAAGTVPLLRVSTWSRDLITRALDAGAHGVMIPQVETAQVARSVVAATRYGPGGTRGTAGNRRSGYGLRIPIDEYVEAANRNVFVSVQVESTAAVSNVEEIAAVEGLDCVFLGLSDLSVDLSVPGQWHHPRLVEQIERIMAACAASGVAFGLPTPSVELARDYVNRGARFIATGDVGIFARAMEQFTREVKQSSD